MCLPYPPHLSDLTYLSRPPVTRPKKIVLWIVVIGLAIQLVPYGRAHTNPPVVQEPAWDSATTRDLARVACFDCHSNETVWPWYANVAPSSWLLEYDVSAGRQHLNFSEWQNPQRHAKDAAEEVRTKDMPQFPYPLMHAGARLTDGQREQFAASFEKMFGKNVEGDKAH